LVVAGFRVKDDERGSDMAYFSDRGEEGDIMP
jgi:hypothetical protein